MYRDLLTIGPWGHPSPLRHADVLNGWSLSRVGFLTRTTARRSEFGVLSLPFPAKAWILLCLMFLLQTWNYGSL